MNKLYYGDNLQVLRDFVLSESVDLVYLDPPFNSNRDYNVIFRKKDGGDKRAQIQAFTDTWTWTQESERLYQDIVSGGLPLQVADTIESMHRILGENNLLAYLVMMAPRLVELRRVLKPSGTLYLHCDPTASHYLKLLLDSTFGPEAFANEIVWAYKYGGRSKQAFGQKHDIIFRYAGKGATFNSADPRVRVPHEEASLKLNFRHVDEDGRRYREGKWSNGKTYRYYADEGRLRDDVITDINSLHQADKERLGYPTQKPKALLELLISASSNPGDVVLDPFCGCGTAVDAAQALGREWVGIDVSYLAVDLIDKRLQHTYGEAIASTYDIVGIPRDLDGARALFAHNPFDFERWAVSLVYGQPNEKQVGDKGIDGIIRFHTGRTTERMIVSVKGGKNLTAAMVRELKGTVETQKAAMGIIVTLEPPTRGMIDAVQHSGIYTMPSNGQQFPLVQAITVEELLAGKRPDMPPPLMPYTQAQRHRAAEPEQGTMFA